MNNTKRGKLIVFEGIDGTGKSTQLQMAAETLQCQGYEVVATREPTNGPHGQRIRQLYQNRETASREEELQLFIDDRKEHVQSVIEPALSAGKIVLCDRYYLSTAAYQGAAGLDPEKIISRNSFAPEPDLAIIFQLEPEESISRITGSRGDQLNDFEQQDSLERVKTIFDQMDFRYITRIDASLSVELVHQDVIKRISSLLQDKELFF